MPITAWYDLIYRQTALQNLDEIKDDTQELFTLQMKSSLAKLWQMRNFITLSEKRQMELEMQGKELDQQERRRNMLRKNEK